MQKIKKTTLVRGIELLQVLIARSGVEGVFVVRGCFFF